MGSKSRRRGGTGALTALGVAALLLNGCETMPPAAQAPQGEVAKALAAADPRDRTPGAPGPIIVFFERDSAELTDGAGKLVAAAAAKVAADRATGVVLRGYADQVGPSEVNFLLADARTLAVKAALARAGVDETIIRRIALGEATAIGSTQIDRRVEIELLP